MVRHRYLSHLTSEFGLSLTISLVVITLSFFLHLKWCGSTIHLNEAVFQRYLDNHLTIYPFNIRPFTSQGILILGKILSLSVKTSFFIMQFSLTFILGLCFYRYLRQLNFSKNLSGLGLFLMLASLPILAAHIEPMHTWDDMWAYLFVTLSLLFILKSKLIIGLIWFTLACFAREQSFIFWPILLLAIWLFNKNGNFWKKLVLTIIPILIYGIYLLAKWQPLEIDRLSLIYH